MEEEADEDETEEGEKTGKETEESGTEDDTLTPPTLSPGGARAGRASLQSQGGACLSYERATKQVELLYILYM